VVVIEHPWMRARKLILMLASDRPSAVLNAAHALVRHLHSFGRDLHDLCDVIDAGPPHASSPPPKGQSSDLYKLAVSIHGDRRFNRLPPRSQQFVADMCDWLQRRPATERQERWLRGIGKNLGLGA
jgi:hypothetical protein